MKKKIIITLLIVFCLGFIKINTAYADSLGFECESTTLEVGDTTNCKVIGTTTHGSRGVAAALTGSSNLQLSSVSNISPFNFNMGTTPIYYMSTSVVNAGSFDIARFTITALSAGDAYLYLNDYGDDDGMGFTDETADYFYYLDSVTYPITISSGGDDPTPKSSDSLLTELTPNIGALDQAFVSDNFNYTMSVDFTRVTRINFAVTKSHPMATVGSTICTIPDSTTVESVVCNIQVTAEDTITKSTYSITINNSAYNPPAPPTEDIFINRLTFDVDAVLTPTFEKDVYLYDMSVNFANVREINFTAEVEDGVTITGKKCTLPSSSTVSSTVCNISITKGEKSANYKITVHNTYSPDVQCDMIIRSNVYTIDQNKKVIKVNKDHSLETIKANLSSTCGEIKVYEDKVTITDAGKVVEYKLERIIMPQTGNKKFLYILAFGSVLVIIGVFMFSKNYFFKKEELK